MTFQQWEYTVTGYGGDIIGVKLYIETTIFSHIAVFTRQMRLQTIKFIREY